MNTLVFACQEIVCEDFAGISVQELVRHQPRKQAFPVGVIEEVTAVPFNAFPDRVLYIIIKHRIYIQVLGEGMYANERGNFRKILLKVSLLHSSMP